MSKLIFVSHAEVVVDPAVPVPDWCLNETGRQRAEAFAQSAVLADMTAIWSSTEAKARETATILSKPFGIDFRTDRRLGENDRSATGFLPPNMFEAAADAFFAEPYVSFRGWEKAIDAQARILKAVQEIAANHGSGDLALVSHGAVGTLLFCALMDLPIDRAHDQPRQGCYWRAELEGLSPLHPWTPIA